MESLLAFLAPYPPTLNEGLATSSQAANNSPHAHPLEVLFLEREVRLACLQFRLGVAELDVAANGGGGGGGGGCIRGHGGGRIGFLHRGGGRRERDAEYRVPAGPFGRSLDQPSDPAVVKTHG